MPNWTLAMVDGELGIPKRPSCYWSMHAQLWRDTTYAKHGGAPCCRATMTYPTTSPTHYLTKLPSPPNQSPQNHLARHRIQHCLPHNLAHHPCRPRTRSQTIYCVTRQVTHCFASCLIHYPQPRALPHPWPPLRRLNQHPTNAPHPTTSSNPRADLFRNWTSATRQDLRAPSAKRKSPNSSFAVAVGGGERETKPVRGKCLVGGWGAARSQRRVDRQPATPRPKWQREQRREASAAPNVPDRGNLTGRKGQRARRTAQLMAGPCTRGER